MGILSVLFLEDCVHECRLLIKDQEMLLHLLLLSLDHLFDHLAANGACLL